MAKVLPLVPPDEPSQQDVRELDLEILANTEPKPPKFIVDGWLPEGEVTLLGAHGGVGKSMVGLQLAVSIAASETFFGLQTNARSVAFVSYEDSEPVLHWRLSRICKWMDNYHLSALDGRLRIFDGSRAMGSWFTQVNGEVGPTKQYFEMTERLYGSDVIIVDGASDTFSANENDRGQVKGFIRILRRLIPKNGALLLLAHVDKNTARLKATTEGYSGSTAWHNGPRARWYMQTGEDGDLVLELQKSNLGRAGAKLKLHWDPQAHVFDGKLEEASSFDQRHQQRTELASLRRAFQAAAAAQLPVPAATQGQRTAYHVLSIQRGFPQSLKGNSPKTIRQFWSTMEELRRIRHIEEASIRRSNRHLLLTLVLTTEGKNACVECAE